MKSVKRFTDWFQGWGHAAGEGDGWGNGSGGSISYAWNMGAAPPRRESRGAGIMNSNSPMHMSSDDGVRTQRIFRCPGCIGHYECSIHGRRL